MNHNKDVIAGMTEARKTPNGVQWIGGEPSVLVFDVNETLIDFESMNPLFERIFGDTRVMREWLGHLIMYSMTITLSGLYEGVLHPGRPAHPAVAFVK